ncbi:fumarate reductase flavoprotein subunit [Amycolatopsis bartoniae]|uniref:Fumarate reductase flavoprotein subunit n=1 Tax=Amycolatopsis bartoniae TaxID=941986 RepID=A0A8H9IXC4_9PSEU|nr:FAD-binding protein [Amycolatopsis bartoniae]MBB2937972.1 fumarate reductase flavoprotein subunit [Amycolatopsis bartoniae]GHF42054.1 fumarate reductase flavoprotein subunit [Amycolatopsis bartoniae]
MTDTDLLVAGAGGGLCGALRAAQLGLRVLVAEANPHFLQGNNTAMSTAMVPGAGSRFQRAAGVEDSPARFLADIAAKTGSTADPVVAEALATVSAPLVEWLADVAGLPIELPTDFGYPGHSVPRVHTIAGRHGSVLLSGLAEQAGRVELIDLLVPARLTALRPSPEGWTAVLTRPDGETEEISARAVLLATNGYGADPALVAEHLPEIAAADYHGSEYSRGDALRISTELGAATGFLDAYQGHAGLSSAARTLVTWTTVMHGAILVDESGHRFGNETVGYSEYAAMLAARPGAAGWLVFDDRIHEASLAFTDYRQVVDSGAVRRATTVAELAAATGLPAGPLARELAEAVAPDRFGRTEFGAGLTPPLRAVRVVPALFHTQGGLRVDEHARVLRPDGSAIPGLYASGGAAAGISGHGAGGYLAGNGLLPALGLAYLAATHAAQVPSEGEGTE